MDRPRPENEVLRLEALASYRVLDSPPEFAYDALTELAAAICDCPVAVIGLIDETEDLRRIGVEGLAPDFLFGSYRQDPARFSCLVRDEWDVATLMRILAHEA